MPAIHPKTGLRFKVAIRADDLVESGIRGGVILIDFFDGMLETVRAAEIIFGTGATDGWELVSIQIEFNLALSTTIRFTHGDN